MKRYYMPCSMGCRGFIVSASDRFEGEDHIERCDDCGRFESDEEAARYAYVMARWAEREIAARLDQRGLVAEEASNLLDDLFAKVERMSGGAQNAPLEDA